MAPASANRLLYYVPRQFGTDSFIIIQLAKGNTEFETDPNLSRIIDCYLATGFIIGLEPPHVSHPSSPLVICQGEARPPGSRPVPAAGRGRALGPGQHRVPVQRQQG